jgi:integrase/recombinase XerD
MAVRRTIKRSSEPDVLTLFIAFDEFITEKEAKNLSYPTLHNYRQTFRMFCTFHEFDDETLITEINPNLFYKWINTLKLEGVKHTSINHYLRDCRAFFYWCMDADRRYIEKPFKIEMVKGQEESIKTFTDEELNLLLEKPRRNEDFVTWRTWVIVNWVIATGNRASTICEIQIGDVDFKSKEIRLRHTKNKKAHIIPPSSSLATILKEYLKLWRWDCRDTEWLFPNVGEE